MEVIKQYQLIDHGLDHIHDLPSFSTVDTTYNMRAIGLGSNPQEAFDDALFRIEEAGWSTKAIRKAVPPESLPIHPDVNEYRMSQDEEDDHRYVYVIQFWAPLLTL